MEQDITTNSRELKPQEPWFLGKEYETKEVWYPYVGGGEMKEIPYSQQSELPPCTEDSKLVAVINE